MALTTRRVQVGSVDMERCRINECQLTKEAFLCNKFTLRVEEGKFMTVGDYPVVSELPYYCTYKYRLTCDPSPFPPQHMWKEPSGAPDLIRFWEWNQFQGHKRSVHWQTTREGEFFNTCKRAIGWGLMQVVADFDSNESSRLPKQLSWHDYVEDISKTILGTLHVGFLP